MSKIESEYNKGYFLDTETGEISFDDSVPLAEQLAATVSWEEYKIKEALKKPHVQRKLAEHMEENNQLLRRLRKK